MREYTIARRYARALVEIGRKQDTLAELETGLQTFAQLLSDPSSDFAQVMLNPAFTTTERLAVIQKIYALFGIPEVVQKALSLLVQKNRFALLPFIKDAFVREVDERLGRARATITSAAPLEQRTLDEIVQGLSSRVGKSVVVDTVVDPSLLGGVSAQIGGLLFDGSVKAELHRLEQALMQAASA